MRLLGSSIIAFLCLLITTTTTEAYDVLDPAGNITIKWDVMSWTPDGYVAVVTMYNFQKYRHIQAPGWKLQWEWAKKEVIWGMLGGQATEQGDCSKFKGSIPHSCKKNPTIVDLLPGTPFVQQIANCCKGGVINSLVQDPATAAASFQISVGLAGTTNKTVKLPLHFTLKAPGPGYTCGKAKQVKATKFVSSDTMRITQAMMTWNVTCTYSQFVAQKTPTCCVSLSSFYDKDIVPCQTCSCGCQNTSQPESCVDPDIDTVVPSLAKNNFEPLVRCTSHMCPVRVHWHVKLNYKEYWRVKLTITNFNYNMNYSGWNLAVQHPNFNNVNEIFSFNFMPVSPYAAASPGTIYYRDNNKSPNTSNDDIIWTDDTAMLWGMKYFNEMLTQSGSLGNVQTEILFRKNLSSFTLEKGWAFPRRVYFNGDNCVMPQPEDYPVLPNAAPHCLISSHLTSIFVALVFLYGYA